MRRALVLALLVAACTKSSGHVDIDQARFTAAAEERWAKALQRPEVSSGFDALFTDAFADPAVAAAGGTLGNTLTGDAEVGRGAQAILARMQGDAAIVQLAQSLMAANPGATPDEIGKLAGAHMAGVASSPAYQRAWMRAWGELMASPDVAAAMRRFGEAVAASPVLARALADVGTPALDDKIEQHLVELNGGTMPDRERATDLALDHLFAADRLARAYTDLLALPSVKRAVTAALADLARAPAFAKVAIAEARLVLGDPVFRDRAVEVVDAFAAAAPTEDDLYPVFARLLSTPSVHKAVIDTVDRLLDDPDLASIGQHTLADIVHDPGFRAVIVRLITDW